MKKTLPVNLRTVRFALARAYSRKMVSKLCKNESRRIRKVRENRLARACVRNLWRKGFEGCQRYACDLAAQSLNLPVLGSLS